METTIKDEKEEKKDISEDGSVRVYEIGYHILSTVNESEVEGIVAGIRSEIEKAGGSFIAEGASQSMKLAYTMSVNYGGKNTHYDRSYFGWIKFESDSDTVAKLNEALLTNRNILRFLIFKTLREDTRASIKPAVLREVKRTDTIKSAPKIDAETEKDTSEISDKDLDKALEDITTD